MVKRGRQGDPSDYETFVQQEEAELKASDSSGQALEATASKADIIDNEVANTLQENRRSIAMQPQGICGNLRN